MIIYERSEIEVFRSNFPDHSFTPKCLERTEEASKRFLFTIFVETFPTLTSCSPFIFHQVKNASNYGSSSRSIASRKDSFIFVSDPTARFRSENWAVSNVITHSVFALHRYKYQLTHITAASLLRIQSSREFIPDYIRKQSNSFVGPMKLPESN